jgi:Family of unknown function (DUF6502)
MRQFASPMKPPTPPAKRSVVPNEEHAQLSLREARGLMVPIVRWLLRHGVSYSAFADLLKGVFVQVAREELSQGGVQPSHSALSVLSGVHRKDVRVLADAVPHVGTPRNIPLASQLFTRWLTDPACRGADGQAINLPRAGAEPSFETLARQLSNDVHPRTLLDELLRLGLVSLDGDTVVPAATSFVPAAGLAEMTALFSANAADHLAAAVHNLTENGPSFLEQSVFANGLSEASTRLLAQTARMAWKRTFDELAAQATERINADKASPENFRMRYGVYFYSEPVAEVPAAEPQPQPATKPEPQSRPRAR